MSNKLTGDAGQTDIPSVLWQNKRNGGRGITELFDTVENKGGLLIKESLTHPRPYFQLIGAL